MKKLKNKSSILMLVTCAFLLSATSCGPTVRVKITGTKDGVTVNTSQTSNDSTGLNIQVNPNITLK